MKENNRSATRAIKQAARPQLSSGELTLHPDESMVKRSGKPIQLSKKEYQLLEFLVRHKNKVINRAILLEYIWNYNVQSITNTLEVHMCKLRRKIDDDYSNKILQTVYGMGYRFCEQTRTLNEPDT